MEAVSVGESLATSTMNRDYEGRMFTTSVKEKYEDGKDMFIAVCERRRFQLRTMIGLYVGDMEKEGLGKDRVLALNDEIHELRKELRRLDRLLSHLKGQIGDVPGGDPEYNYYPPAQKYWQDVHKLPDEKQQPELKKRPIEGSEKIFEDPAAEPKKREVASRRMNWVRRPGEGRPIWKKEIKKGRAIWKKEIKKMDVKEEAGASHEVEK